MLMGRARPSQYFTSWTIDPLIYTKSDSSVAASPHILLRGYFRLAPAGVPLIPWPTYFRLAVLCPEVVGSFSSTRSNHSCSSQRVQHKLQVCTSPCRVHCVNGRAIYGHLTRDSFKSENLSSKVRITFF